MIFKKPPILRSDYGRFFSGSQYIYEYDIFLSTFHQFSRNEAEAKNLFSWRNMVNYSKSRESPTRTYCVYFFKQGAQNLVTEGRFHRGLANRNTQKNHYKIEIKITLKFLFTILEFMKLFKDIRTRRVYESPDNLLSWLFG